MITNQIGINTCDLCRGSGKVNSKKCPVCEGFGLWEFVIDDNEAAVRFLNDMTADVSDRAKEICGQRIHSAPPDSIEQMLQYLNQGANETSYNRIHNAAGKRWDWAWVHANRFAIALCKLNGVDHTIYAFGLIQLVWHWLEFEQQERVSYGV